MASNSASIDDLNKTLPNGGIDITHVKNYLTSTDPKLAYAAEKIIALQSLGIWDSKGKATGSSDPSDFTKFGKINFTQADVDAKLKEINTMRQKQAQSDYATRKSANDLASAAKKALPFPDLKASDPGRVTSIPGVTGAHTVSSVTPSSQSPLQ